MAENTSTRASILRRVLRHINEGSYEDSARTDLVRRGAWGPLPEDLLDEQQRLLADLGRETSDYLSLRASRERTKLGPLRPPPPRLGVLIGLLKRISSQKYWAVEETASEHSAGGPDAEITNSLDLYYAAEVLEKVELAVARASALQKLCLRNIPNARVRVCFEEAHSFICTAFTLRAQFSVVRSSRLPWTSESVGMSMGARVSKRW
jgi:hypothetical protein